MRFGHAGAPPTPLPPLYSAAGGGRSSEDGGWRSRPAPAHHRCLCPAPSPGRRGRPSRGRRSPRCCPSLRRSPAPLLTALPPFSPLRLLPPSFPSPSVLPLHPARHGGERGGFSLGLYRTAGGPGRRGVRDSPPPPPRPRGHRRDTHHAPAILPPNLLPAAPPRAVRTLDFPSGPAPELVRAVRGGGRLSAARCCRLGSGDTTCASAARRLWGAGAPGAPGGAYRHQQAGGGGPRARGTGRLYRALPVAGPPALSEGSHH